MTTDPNQPIETDAIDDLISAPAQAMGEQRDLGFKMIKHRMTEAYAKKLKSGKAPIMVRGSMLTAYAEALEDAFRVFTQMVEASGMDSEGMSG